LRSLATKGELERKGDEDLKGGQYTPEVEAIETVRDKLGGQKGAQTTNAALACVMHKAP